MVNSPLIRPAISWGVNVALGGGFPLGSHDFTNFHPLCCDPQNREVVFQRAHHWPKAPKWFLGTRSWNFPRKVAQILPRSLTVRRWKVTETQKERLVFQPSFFRDELLNFRGVVVSEWLILGEHVDDVWWVSWWQLNFGEFDASWNGVWFLEILMGEFPCVHNAHCRF